MPTDWIPCKLCDYHPEWRRGRGWPLKGWGDQFDCPRDRNVWKGPIIIRGVEKPIKMFQKLQNLIQDTCRKRAWGELTGQCYISLLLLLMMVVVMKNQSLIQDTQVNWLGSVAVLCFHFSFTCIYISCRRGFRLQAEDALHSCSGMNKIL